MGCKSVSCELHGRWKPWLNLELTGLLSVYPRLSGDDLPDVWFSSQQSHVLLSTAVHSFPLRPSLLSTAARFAVRSWGPLIGWLAHETPPTSVGSTEIGHGSTKRPARARECAWSGLDSIYPTFRVS
ncbi:hypothetical protein ILYODFUR_038107 [Ilyodon furcidens]|uniref:Uncharacterized protein n=1 Tax=Ilyodon furcidens TaxID=33524 RepID=A0ABV0T6Y5_9TELE